MERQCLWVRQLYTEKIFPELIYRFNTICIETLGRFFLLYIGKIILKCIWEGVRATLAKTI